MELKVFLLFSSVLFLSCEGGKTNDGFIPIKQIQILNASKGKLPENATKVTLPLNLNDMDTETSSEELEFAPGIPENPSKVPVSSNPLTRFRDSFLNSLIPSLQRPFSRQANTLEFVTDCSTFSGQQCGDCNTLIFCNRETAPVTSITCPVATPFCTPNGCSETSPDATCQAAVPTSTFLCSAEGYFPDPEDCSRFHYCSGISATAVDYKCPNNYHYNSFTRNCQLRILMVPRCKPIECAGKTNDYVVFPQNNGYFAYCFADRVQMFKCPDADHQVFDPLKLGCDYKCRRKGFYADNLDCQSYYFCYRDGIFGLKYQRYTCPEGYSYEGNRCVKSATQCVNVA